MDEYKTVLTMATPEMDDILKNIAEQLVKGYLLECLEAIVDKLFDELEHCRIIENEADKSKNVLLLKYTDGTIIAVKGWGENADRSSIRFKTLENINFYEVESIYYE